MVQLSETSRSHIIAPGVEIEEAGVALGGEQVLDGDEHALKPVAKRLVTLDRGIDQFLCYCPPLA